MDAIKQKQNKYKLKRRYMKVYRLFMLLNIEFCENVTENVDIFRKLM